MTFVGTKKTKMTGDFHAKIYREQVERLFKQVPINFPGNLLCVVSYAVVFWDIVPHAVIFGWAAYSQIVNGWGVALVFAHRRNPGRVSVRSWDRWFIAYAAADAATWGSAALLFFTIDSPTHTLFLIATLLGVMGGAQIAFVSRIPVVVIYDLILVLPLEVSFLSAGELIYYAMAGLSLAYIGLMFNFFVRFNRNLAQNWRLSYRHELNERTIRQHRDQLEQRVLERTAELREALHDLEREAAERRAAESRLIQAQKMEAVGRLSGGLAHDFNNLLTVVLGNPDLLAENLNDDRENQIIAERAADATHRGAEITQRLLAFARQQPLAPKAINLNELVEGVADLLPRTLGKSISIVAEPAPDLWPCFADAGQLESALVNLAINARDAMPDGGTLTIRTANLSAEDTVAHTHDDMTPGDYVVLSIADTGTGMTAETIDKVFEPFFTTKGVGKGSGLGLSMVYGFIKQSGGHIAIESEPGRGTTVRLYLPRTDVLNLPDTVHTSPGLAARGETVLVVEDEEDVRQLTVFYLKSLGYHVLEAEDGRDALSQLEAAKSIDLLFTDVVLPGGINGRDVAQIAMGGHPNIEVLYCSGQAESILFEQNMLLEGTAFLAKPFRRQELAAKVRATLDRQSPHAGHKPTRRRDLAVPTME